MSKTDPVKRANGLKGKAATPWTQEVAHIDLLRNPKFSRWLKETDYKLRAAIITCGGTECLNG